MTGVRIQLIGGSGSGTSTVGRVLAAALALPHFESDDYYHAPTDPPYQRPRPAAERYELVCRDLKPSASWVLSGGMVGWTPSPQLALTCIVLLDVPTAVRIERLRRRERARFGDRIDEGGDMCDTHREFIDWASRYDVGGIEGKTLARHEAYLSSQSCVVIRYHGVDSAAVVADKVFRSMSEAGVV